MQRQSASPTLHGVRGIVLDLDGTLIRGGRALVGAVEAVARLRRLGIRIVYCTQDSEHGAAAIAARLNGYGFAAEASEVVSTGALLENYLQSRYAGLPVQVLGNAAQIRLLAELGLRLAEQGEAVRAVVLSLYDGFCARDVELACQAVWQGAELLAIGLDRTFPAKDLLLPGTGGFVKAVEHVTRRRARIVGKPSPSMARAALKRLGCRAEQVLVVGDTVDADVRLGKAAGCRTVLVLSGTTSADTARRLPLRWQPDLVLADVAALPDRLGQPAGLALG